MINIGTIITSNGNSSKILLKARIHICKIGLPIYFDPHHGAQIRNKVEKTLQCPKYSQILLYNNGSSTNIMDNRIKLVNTLEKMLKTKEDLLSK